MTCGAWVTDFIFSVSFASLNAMSFGKSSEVMSFVFNFSIQFKLFFSFMKMQAIRRLIVDDTSSWYFSTALTV